LDQEITKEDKLLALKELQTHPGWRIYQGHLESQWIKKEREKAQALRANNPFLATARQFEIDALKLAVNELEKVIDLSYSSAQEENEV
jgi:hypothetical protein